MPKDINKQIDEIIASASKDIDTGVKIKLQVEGLEDLKDIKVVMDEIEKRRDSLASKMMAELELGNVNEAKAYEVELRKIVSFYEKLQVKAKIYNKSLKNIISEQAKTKKQIVDLKIFQKTLGATSKGYEEVGKRVKNLKKNLDVLDYKEKEVKSFQGTVTNLSGNLDNLSSVIQSNY